MVYACCKCQQAYIVNWVVVNELGADVGLLVYVL